MTMEEIANKLNEWIDADHDFSEESMHQFCLAYARNYDEYMGLWYTVCGCIEENWFEKFHIAYWQPVGYMI